MVPTLGPDSRRGPHSQSGIKVCGEEHGLKISRSTCQLWTAVVNLILWKWVNVMCENVLQQKKTITN